MERKKKHTTYFLLILYTVVLVHHSIAHRYDGEILNTLFSCCEEFIYDFLQQTETYEHDDHFNVFSEDINLNAKKQIVFTDFIFPEIPVIHPFYLTYKKRDNLSHHYCCIQPYSIFFSLRSPPLAS